MNAVTADWFALYVKSRHEFAVENELIAKGIEVFLPAVKKLRRWKDRKKLLDFPLFPGYLFFRTTSQPEELSAVIRTPGVVCVISGAPGCPVAVPESEISALKRIVGSGVQIDMYPHLKEGVRVRVRSGLFQGVEGVITRKDGQAALLVNIGIFGRSVSVPLSPEDVDIV
jgi:transcription termination/antitermination protein NusG